MEKLVTTVSTELKMLQLKASLGSISMKELQLSQNFFGLVLFTNEYNNIKAINIYFDFGQNSIGSQD